MENNINIDNALVRDIYNEFLEDTKEIREKATPESIEEYRLKLEKALEDLENNNVSDINKLIVSYFTNLFYFLAQKNINFFDRNDKNLISYLERFYSAISSCNEKNDKLYEKISSDPRIIIIGLILFWKNEIDFDNKVSKEILLFNEDYFKTNFDCVQYIYSFLYSLSKVQQNLSLKLFYLKFISKKYLNPFNPNFSFYQEKSTKDLKKIQKILNELEKFNDDSFEFQDFVNVLKGQIYRYLDNPEKAIQIFNSINTDDEQVRYTKLVEEILSKIMLREKIGIEYIELMNEIKSFPKDNSLDDVAGSLCKNILIGFIYKQNGFFDQLINLWKIDNNSRTWFRPYEFIKDLYYYESYSIDNLRIYVKYFVDYFSNEIINLSLSEFVKLLLEDKCPSFFNRCYALEEKLNYDSNLFLSDEQLNFLECKADELININLDKPPDKVKLYNQIMIKTKIINYIINYNGIRLFRNIDAAVMELERLNAKVESKFYSDDVDEIICYFDESTLFKIKDILNNELLKLKTEFEYEAKLKHEHELQEMKLKTERSLRSFLAHTLRNTLSTGPETVKQIIALLKEVKQNQNISSPIAENYLNKALIRSTNILTTFSFVENLLDTFKLYSVNTENLHQVWMEDKGNDTNIRRLISISLLQSLSRIIYAENFIQEFITLVGANKKDEVRNSFSDELLFAPHSETFEENTILNWIQNNIHNLEINIQTNLPRLNQKGVRHSILFAIFSELILNSFKYSDYKSKTKISWEEKDNHYNFICENSYNPDIKTQKGSRKGIDFINQLTKDIGGIEIKTTTENGIYKSEIIFNKELFE